MRGKKYIAGALVLAAGVAGFGAFRTWFPAYASTKGKASLGYAEEQATPPAQSKVNTPQTIRPKISVEDNYLRLTGSLVADQKSEVASTANGVVQEVRIERGSVVQKGDVLVVVDPT
ncbi:MAG: biotin/lipoyl-binding protein, partial [Candidatus Hydrogenedentales bacterium]